MRTGASEAVIGLCDWLAGNLGWSNDELLVVHDRDSVAADSEDVLAGFAAAQYSTVSTRPGTRSCRSPRTRPGSASARAGI